MTLLDYTPLGLALGLMEGDPDAFKVGYTAENAVLAVAEHYSLDADGTEALRDDMRAVGVDV